jgi:hypothetical protein
MSMIDDLAKPIASAQDADAQISSLAKGLWVLVAIQGGLLAFIGLGSNPTFALSSMPDVVALAACAWFLPRKRSRSLAIGLVALSAGALLTSVLASAGMMAGGKNVYLGIILLVASLQGARAIFVWHKFVPHTALRKNVAITTLLGFGYAAVVLVAVAVGLMVSSAFTDE